MKPEYDFASITGGVRGKYAARYRQEINIVKLNDDMFAAFPDSKTLRSLMQDVKVHTKQT